ncbi:hypothetical protein P170DRAFT_436118 [Aspergillus steynii IBT 23096]|uniref:Uncharacterized protein n=1 Tax=Aspergillus steynii IBT 23096 TaxID=1392250 RepID=A0A2I2GDR1_9EURO|nr:uncharacterized protein P170DRAFT_436118 [Aspergillus steynii IBT 23096]PLB51034.1 hypothetical protein P170DRAFT_436118 [Aspergillus steynii IBT 23096]
MSPATYFPEKLWLSKSITFSSPSSPSSSTWIITRKINEKAYPFDEEDAKEFLEPPSACATFECTNSESALQKGVMQVDMQIPYEGTEYLPESDRVKQATGKFSLGMSLEIRAYELLDQTSSKYTPRLRGHMQAKQASDSAFVPEGSIQYLVYTAVPGIPLGDGCCHRRKDGRNQSDGPYWEFSSEEREEIRTAFHDAYREMLFAGVDMPSQGLQNLYWDEGDRRLYIYGPFEPMNTGIRGYSSHTPTDFGPLVLRSWGLAIAPRGKVDYDVAIADLENSGWVL